MEQRVLTDLFDHSLEELATWRNSAHKRIKNFNRTIDDEIDSLEKDILKRIAKINKLERQKNKTILWYKSIGKAIHRKIKGISFTDEIFG